MNRVMRPPSREKMTYWMVCYPASFEMLGILKSYYKDNDAYTAEVIAINEKLGHVNWDWGYELTEVEFSTYQVFGITEFKPDYSKIES